MNKLSAFREIILLQEKDREVKADSNKASALLKAFFSSLLQEHADLLLNPLSESVRIGLLIIKEIKNTVQRAKLFKAAEDNSIPTVVWKEI